MFSVFVFLDTTPATVYYNNIKDKDFLIILDEIIDSTDSVRNTSSKLTGNKGIGVPIGNYLSQYFANLYLSELDHLCKEELKCKFYYRYADDIVIYRLNHFPINFKITKYDWRIYVKNRKENVKPQT